MPYSVDKPPAWLNNLPKGAQRLGVEAFNAVYAKTKDDDKARKAAWGAIKTKYQKQGDKWVRKADLDGAGALAAVDLVITKAVLRADGSMRWQAVVSDVVVDTAGDQTSLQLFNDWIARVERAAAEEWLPAPRVPFLGLSHYPDLDGAGEAGLPERIFVDGARFKADGYFKMEPLGRALFEAVHQEREMIKRGEAPERPIRISAAWWDIEHAHGDYVFRRRSLADVCPMCALAETGRTFLAGQLDHFAATRVPINPRTELALEERSMATTRKDDAASIVGEELAEDLEAKAQEMVGKSEADDGEAGLVVKADEIEEADPVEDPPEADPAEVVEQASTAFAVEEFWRPYGGATSLTEAEEYIKALQIEDQIWSNWDIFNNVISNILGSPDEDLDKLGAVKTAVSEFSTRVTAIKANVTDAFLVQSQKGGATMAGENQTPQPVTLSGEDPAVTLKAQVDAALLNSAAGRDATLQAVQGAIETYGHAVKAQVDAVYPPSPGEEVKAAIKEGMQPLVDSVWLLLAKMGQQPAAPASVPTQKSASTPVAPGSLDVQKPPSIRDLTRRSVGLTN